MDESNKSRRVETREFWEAAIRLWTEGDLSVREFCSREGLAEHTFYSWRRELLPGSSASEVTESHPPPRTRPPPIIGDDVSGGGVPVPLAQTRPSSSSCRSVSSATKVRVPTRQCPRRQREHRRSRSSGLFPGSRGRHEDVGRLSWLSPNGQLHRLHVARGLVSMRCGPPCVPRQSWPKRSTTCSTAGMIRPVYPGRQDSHRQQRH